MPPAESVPPRAAWSSDEAGVVLELAGNWSSTGPQPAIQGDSQGKIPAHYVVDELGEFDSSLPAYLLANLREAAADAEAEQPSLEGLPENLRALMDIALGVPEREEARRKVQKTSFLQRFGKFSVALWTSCSNVAGFVGMCILSFGRFFIGKAKFRRSDFMLLLYQCGPQALPIVGLISFLIGLILAFVGSVQLSTFGADLYIADLVGIAMVREMGVLMTSIIMSGRTGAAFAAALGSMKANEEIDALSTFGFKPFDFLVLPRMLALVIMLPLLTVFSNVIGILGGMLVGVMVDIPPILYYRETLTMMTFTTVSMGVFKSFFFGIAIAICGCMQGMSAGNSSAAVGEATTRAVVASITTIIVLDSIFAVIFTVFDI